MKIDQNIIDKLYNLAKEAFEDGEIPISAVILNNNNEIIAFERNKRQKSYDILGHAEILCIQKAEKEIKDWRLDGYKMIVTLEPCDMCSMIIKKSRLDEIYYILESDSYECTNDFEINKKKLDIDKIGEEKFRKLLTDFFDNKR